MARVWMQTLKVPYFPVLSIPPIGWSNLVSFTYMIPGPPLAMPNSLPCAFPSHHPSHIPQQTKSLVTQAIDPTHVCSSSLLRSLLMVGSGQETALIPTQIRQHEYSKLHTKIFELADKLLVPRGGQVPRARTVGRRIPLSSAEFCREVQSICQQVQKKFDQSLIWKLVIQLACSSSTSPTIIRNFTTKMYPLYSTHGSPTNTAPHGTLHFFRTLSSWTRAYWDSHFSGTSTWYTSDRFQVAGWCAREVRYQKTWYAEELSHINFGKQSPNTHLWQIDKEFDP